MTSLVLTYGISKDKCSRPTMEDYSNFAVLSYMDINFKLFNICDGHGGKEVANFINEEFHKFLQQKIILMKRIDHTNKLSSSVIKQLILETCFHLDYTSKQILASQYSGTTFAGILFYRNKIYTINIGDSIILFNKNNKIVFENILHTPENKIELKRINKNAFVLNKRINGKINITRSFGDFNYKRNDNILTNPIIAKPDISRLSIKSLIKKSDDVWISLMSDGALLQLNKETYKQTINNFLSIGFNAQKITDILVSYMKYNNNRDNVTLILIILTPPKLNTSLRKQYKNYRRLFVGLLNNKYKYLTRSFKNKDIIIFKFKEYYDIMFNELLSINPTIYDIFKYMKQELIKEYISHINSLF